MAKVRLPALASRRVLLREEEGDPVGHGEVGSYLPSADHHLHHQVPRGQIGALLEQVNVFTLHLHLHLGQLYVEGAVILASAVEGAPGLRKTLQRPLVGADDVVRLLVGKPLHSSQRRHHLHILQDPALPNAETEGHCPLNSRRDVEALQAQLLGGSGQRTGVVRRGDVVGAACAEAQRSGGERGQHGMDAGRQVGAGNP
mmetsp:Transcript_1097/g.2828  ORF Transcript_1097/g.2828 Transcript_1097/m.2828 type:complete len:200 (+) Transcript_1097:652-1251(+)